MLKLDFLSIKGVLIFLLIIVGWLYISLLVRFVAAKEISFSHIDEIPFIVNAKSFAETHSLRASFFVEEEVSTLTESDWYGPAYPIIFGSLRFLLGNVDKSFIYANFLLLLLLLYFVFKFKSFSIDDRLTLILMMLLSAVVVINIFCFMPIVLDLLLASILLYFFFQIREEFSFSNSSFWVFFIATVFVACVKQNFIFFLFGLLPFSKTFSGTLKILLLVAAAFVFNQLYVNLFNAPPTKGAAGMEAIGYFLRFDFQQAFTIITKCCSKNIDILFCGNACNLPIYLAPFPSFYVPQYVIVLLVPLLSLSIGIVKKNTQLTALGAIGLFSILFYFAFYSLGWFYFTRISAPLLLVNCASILLYPSKIKPFVVAIFLVTVILQVVPACKNAIWHQDFRQQNALEVNRLKTVFEPIQTVTSKAPITILYDYNFYSLFEVNAFTLALPLKNNVGTQIRYTVNDYNTNPLALHRKMKIDFVLCAQAQSIPNSILLQQTNSYYLYKLQQ